MSESQTTARPATEIPSWKIKANYVEACNCDHGCPCNFNGYPTYGFCRALVLYAVKSGSYGNVRLDGTDVILAASWPKAIHEGNGTGQLYISKNTSQEQRDAVLKIFSGQAKGDGPFAIFAPTFKYLLEPQFVEIKKTIDGKNSTFSVPGALDVQVETFRNPVTGEVQDTEIRLPKGFIWKLGHAAKSKLMRISTPNLNFDDTGQSVIVSEVEYAGP